MINHNRVAGRELKTCFDLFCLVLFTEIEKADHEYLLNSINIVLEWKK